MQSIEPLWFVYHTLPGVSSEGPPASTTGSVGVGQALILAGNSVEIASISGLCSEDRSVTSGASTASATSATVSVAARLFSFNGLLWPKFFVALVFSASNFSSVLFWCICLRHCHLPLHLLCFFLPFDGLPNRHLFSIFQTLKLILFSCSNGLLSFSVIKILSMPLSARFITLITSRDQLLGFPLWSFPFLSALLPVRFKTSITG